ncbi:hypothetical protein GWI33_000513 [Rhynchophorus ferrugineus]|uniref:Uncharacterized protein n=1 Tax=Rhynchophorus ferrugineus TaxID=354439 RepID=A0A834M3W8_RHYFE|nr:hypothetical protein GWI33_000513 [Rhynchophorus ferrugineus]
MLLLFKAFNARFWWLGGSMRKRRPSRSINKSADTLRVTLTTFAETGSVRVFACLMRLRTAVGYEAESPNQICAVAFVDRPLFAARLMHKCIIFASELIVYSRKLADIKSPRIRAIQQV